MKKLPVVVISLFNGLSGARLALEQVKHLEVLRFYSSEVDKYAIQTADHNFPEDILYKLGDVTKIDFYKLLQEIRKKFGNVKIIIIGGSPCQGFSMAGLLNGSSTACGVDVDSYGLYRILKKRNFKFKTQSYLFWEFYRAIRAINPDYFLLENVRVTKKWLPMFNEAMGVEPLELNSKLLSAQNRNRFYWHNLGEIEQPDDERKNLVIRDILEESMKPGRPCKPRNFKEDSACHHAATATDIKGNESIKRVYAESGKSSAVTTCQGGHREPKFLLDKICNVNPSGNGMNGNVYGVDAKSPTVTTNKGEGSKISLDNGNTYRKATPRECARLQTIRDSFEFPVSNSQAYKMIGNGFTIVPVAYILGHIPLELDTNQE